MKRRDMRALRSLVQPMATKVANTVSRAVVSLVSDDRRMQLLQLRVLVGEVLAGAERFQNYGFSSVPLPGAEAVVVFPNGSRRHPLVVAVDDRRHRPTGKPGGHVCLYHHTGAIIEFSEDGDIIATPAEGRQVHLGEGGLTLADGVVHGTGIDPFTGATYAALGSASAVVRAKK